MADQGPAQQGPARWRKDPTGRHYGRWWDGQDWTENVISAEKVQTLDPLPAESRGRNQVLEVIRGWPRWVQWTVGIVAVLVVIGAATAGTDDDKTVSVAQDQPAQPAAIGTPTPTAGRATTRPVATKAPLLDISGAGTKTTEKFTVPKDWDLTWTYDCSGFVRGTGAFQIFIYEGSGAVDLKNALVNQIGSTDAGVEHYHSGGVKYLTVNSTCSKWTITVAPA